MALTKVLDSSSCLGYRRTLVYAWSCFCVLHPHMAHWKCLAGQLSHRAASRASQGDSLQTATFAAGCFWGPELAFQRVPGVVCAPATCIPARRHPVTMLPAQRVRQARSISLSRQPSAPGAKLLVCVQVSTATGYSQGEAPDVTYEQVCSGNTGHAEVVQVRLLFCSCAGGRGSIPVEHLQHGVCGTISAKGPLLYSGTRLLTHEHACVGAVQPRRGVVSTAAGSFHQHPQPHAAEPPGADWQHPKAGPTEGT
jgi:Peptide methionine sulfoxide reductase